MRISIKLAGILALAGCVVAPPPGPSVVAMPGNGKSFEQFQTDDGYCRQAASQATGGVAPATVATDSAVGSAVAGTALGAVTGALLGSISGQVGAGAAIGAGIGLLAGSAAGAGNAQYSAAGVQHQYDMTYAQCMTSQGDQIQQYAAPQPYNAYPPYAGPPYGYGAPYSYYGPRYYYAPRYGY